MEILKWAIAVFLYSFLVFLIFSIVGAGSVAGTAALIFAVFFTALSINKHFRDKKLPGGSKGAVLQGIWVLEKQLKFDFVLRKYQEVQVEPKKNYFEFKGDQFRSGDFDGKHKQLPAEWSFFSVVGDNIIFESEFLKKGHWTWRVSNGKLELIGETINPEGKSQFTFYKKNWN